MAIFAGASFLTGRPLFFGRSFRVSFRRRIGVFFLKKFFLPDIRYVRQAAKIGAARLRNPPADWEIPRDWRGANEISECIRIFRVRFLERDFRGRAKPLRWRSLARMTTTIEKLLRAEFGGRLRRAELCARQRILIALMRISRPPARSPVPAIFKPAIFYGYCSGAFSGAPPLRRG